MIDIIIYIRFYKRNVKIASIYFYEIYKLRSIKLNT